MEDENIRLLNEVTDYIKLKFGLGAYILNIYNSTISITDFDYIDLALGYNIDDVDEIYSEVQDLVEYIIESIREDCGVFDCDYSIGEEVNLKIFIIP